MNWTGKRVGLVVALSATVVLLISLSAKSRREPVVRGVPLSEWMELENKDSDEYRAAVAEMDDRCVRWLIRELDWSPISMQTKIDGFMFRILRQSITPEARPDYRAAAALTLSKLGSRAQEAIPALRANASLPGSGVLWFNDAAQSTAIAALVLLEADSLDSWADNLLSATNKNWQPYAVAARILGTNAAPIIPRLVSTFETTNDDEIKGRIADSFLFIRINPAVSLPIFTASLTNSDSQIRHLALIGLSWLGPESKSARNDLVPLLSDSDRSVRRAATNALRQIDREAALRPNSKEE